MLKYLRFKHDLLFSLMIAYFGVDCSFASEFFSSVHLKTLKESLNIDNQKGLLVEESIVKFTSKSVACPREDWLPQLF